MARKGIPVLDIALDCIALAGAVSVTYGAWLLNPAAGFIVAGLFTLAGAILKTMMAG